MNQVQHEELEQQIGQTLEQQAGELDELTRARLRAARLRALDELPPQQVWWQSLWARLSLAAAASACAVLLAVSLQSTAPPSETLALAEDAALIADLDLLLWLEEGDV